MLKLIMTLLFFTSFAFATDSQFTTNKCEMVGSHMYKRWNIESKMGENKYEVTIFHAGLRTKQKAILTLNSLTYTKTGRIHEVIFVSKTGEKEMKLANGYPINVELYTESTLCKKSLMKEHPTTSSQIIQNSYPKLPLLEKKYAEQYSAKLKAQKEKDREDRIQELLQREKKEILKGITKQGYEKLKESGCYYIGGQAWRKSYNSKKLYIVDTYEKEFAVKESEKSDFVRISNKKIMPDGYKESLPLYADLGCNQIARAHRTKKSKKRADNKRKAKSLYE